MYSEPQNILVNNVIDIMSSYSSLFDSMCIPAVYQNDDESIGLTKLPVCIPSELVKVKFINDYVTEDKAVGQCTVFPTADYMTKYVMLNYPKFEVAFTVQNECVAEDVVLHELIHIYQYTYEYNYFYYSDGYEDRNKKIEKKFHKQYVAPARTRLLRKLSNDIKKVYNERERVIINSCYKALFQDDNKETGKQHDLVFYRLSILLDRMMNYKPGTIFGYSFNKFIEEVQNVIQNKIA